MIDNNLLDKVLEISSNSKGDCALKQGIRFNKEQSELEPLREGFSNNEKKEITLQMVDKKETSASDPLRQKFNEKMTQYSRAFEAAVENRDAEQTAALQAANTELMDMATQLWTRTEKLGDKAGEVQTSLDTERTKLRQQMELLQARSEILQSLEKGNLKLDGELTSKRRDHDSAYTQHIIWFAAAAALTVIAVHKIIAG